MKKVFHCDAPTGRYQADAAVVWCFDNRFHLGLEKYLKRIGIMRPDIIKVAGGAKSLASPAHETDREFILDQIRTSIRLHGTKRVILMLHSDCGAYGGLENFRGDARAEAAHHEGELTRGVSLVRETFPTVSVDAYFVDFEGVWVV